LSTIDKLWRKKTVRALQEEARADSGLKRALGAIDLTAIGIGAIVGAGIFVLTGQAAANYAGPAIVFSFVLAAVASALAAICYAEFASMIPIAGSAYTYSYATLGEFFAWIIGWDLLVEAWLRLLFWLLLGLVIYFLYGIRHSRAAAE